MGSRMKAISTLLDWLHDVLARGWVWLDKPVRPLALRACLEAAAVGNAAAASAEKGQALLDAMGRSLAQLLVEIDQLPADTLRSQTAF